MIIDPRLTDLLEAFGASPWQGEVWRHVFANRDPLEPSWRPGRWSPGTLFPVLYTSLSRDCALAEANHLISRYSIPPSVGRVMASLAVGLERVVDLTIDDRLAQLGVDLAAYALDAGRCPEIGAAANLIEYQAILAPSARHEAGNLVIFTERLNDKCALSVKSTEPVGNGRR
ncbi:MAG: RES family NAD+ phosphorylase [Kiloniellales bacterium]